MERLRLYFNLYYLTDIIGRSNFIKKGRAVKRYAIVIFIALSIFSANFFTMSDAFSKHDFHDNFYSLHEHQHTHNAVKHTHNHSHKVSFIDFYIAESIQIKLSSCAQENNFDFAKLHHSFISKELFRPPIV